MHLRSAVTMRLQELKQKKEELEAERQASEDLRRRVEELEQNLDDAQIARENEEEDGQQRGRLLQDEIEYQLGLVKERETEIASLQRELQIKEEKHFVAAEELKNTVHHLEE